MTSTGLLPRLALGAALLFVASCRCNEALATRALEPVSGSGQTGPVATALALPVVVRLTEGDAGVSGVSVTFTAAQGGSAAPGTAVTDDTGTARATWTLGPLAGAQTLSASVDGVSGPASFTATAVPGATAGLAFTIQPAALVAGKLMTPAPAVTARDAQGNRTPGFTGSVVVSLGANPGGGALGGERTAAAVGGVATFTTLTLDRAAAGYTLTATATGLTPATSDAFTVSPDVPAAVVLVSGGAQSAAPGATLPAPVVVQVNDRLANPVPGQTVTFTPSDGGIAAPPSAVSDAAGRAQTAWTLGPTTGSQGLSVTAGGVGLSVLASAGSSLRFTSVSAGAILTCGITTSGALYCWGSNASGQFAVGSYVPAVSLVPVAAAGGLGFDSVSVGEPFSCGVADGGVAVCWGSNPRGFMLGGGTTVSSTVPVRVVGGHTFASVSAGAAHSCGLTTAGVTLCWGDNDNYQLGDGTENGSGVPVAVDAGALPLRFAQVAAARNAYSCGVTADGGAYCWGASGYGALGIGGSPFRRVPGPLPLADGGVWKSVAQGYDVNCGLRTDGTAWCWGYGQGIRLGDYPDGISVIPLPASGGHTFTALSVGNNHTCGLVDGGAAYCWGSGSYGRLGNGLTTNSTAPVPVSGGLSFATIDVGPEHTCGVTFEGIAYCWGVGTNGRLGDGTGLDRWVPTRVSGQ